MKGVFSMWQTEGISYPINQKNDYVFGCSGSSFFGLS